MFLDTSGLMCLFDSGDHRHTAAIDHFDSTNVRITHNYVLAEFVALSIARNAPAHEALRFVESIGGGSDIEVIWVREELHERAMQLLFARLDKSWSLCDAVSFVVMNERHILDSLTTDHHFEQAGFVRLLEQ
jgi:uncharacterized protein